MARPTKGNELMASEYVGARVPADLRRRIEGVAHGNQRSITEEVRVAIEAHVARQEKAIRKAAGK